MIDSSPELILSLDTATKCCSVAICSGELSAGNILGAHSLNTSVTHSRRLLTVIDGLIQECGIKWVDIAGIAVGLGPGSFTGLRIGMATAKGLAFASVIPLIGVSTLDSFACKQKTSKRICSIIDARKKEVYSAFYKTDKVSGRVVRESDIFALTPEKLAEQITEPVMFVGDGVNSYGEFLKDKLGSLASFGTAVDNICCAATIGLIAGEKLKAGETLDMVQAVPLYIRASDAELSLKHSKQP